MNKTYKMFRAQKTLVPENSRDIASTVQEECAILFGINWDFLMLNMLERISLHLKSKEWMQSNYGMQKMLCLWKNSVIEG